jgi:hypothetical protein
MHRSDSRSDSRFATKGQIKVADGAGKPISQMVVVGYDPLQRRPALYPPAARPYPWANRPIKLCRRAFLLDSSSRDFLSLQLKLRDRQ